MVPTLTWGVNSCHADEACLTWAQLTVMRVSTMTEEQQMFRRASQHRAEDAASIRSKTFIWTLGLCNLFHISFSSKKVSLIFYYLSFFL